MQKFLVEIPLSNLLAGNVSVEIFGRFFQILFGSDFSSNMFGKYFVFRVYSGRCFFQVYLVENCSSEILGTDFSANIFGQ